jgi:hypothetical protein
MKSPLIIDAGVDSWGKVFYPTVAPNATVGAKAATATLSLSDMGLNLTNTGASGTIVLTLPPAATCLGRGFTVQLTVAQIVQLEPNGSESIYLGGSGVAGKYLNIAGVIGNYANVYCDGTQWLVTGYAGVLTKEA